MQFKRPVIFITVLLLVISLLFPPFQMSSLYGSSSLGWHWIFDTQFEMASIDIGRLLIEWMAIGIFSVTLHFGSSYFTPQNWLTALLFCIPLLRIFNTLVLISLFFNAIGGIILLLEPNMTSNQFHQKTIGLVILLTVFFVLKKLINSLHKWLHGNPHPSLKKLWGT